MYVELKLEMEDFTDVEPSDGDEVAYVWSSFVVTNLLSSNYTTESKMFLGPLAAVVLTNAIESKMFLGPPTAVAHCKVALPENWMKNLRKNKRNRRKEYTNSAGESQMSTSCQF